MNNGYIEITMPEHPNARNNGTIYEHRLVAEGKLGRLLKKTEVVHHLDENRSNNSPDNLIVFRTNGDHSRFHKTGVKQEMDDGTYICPISDSRIAQCEYCQKYYIKERNKKKNKHYCSHECFTKAREDKFIYTRPTKEELEKLIYTMSFVQIGVLYSVSDNAVRKWCKKYGLPYKHKDIHSMA